MVALVVVETMTMVVVVTMTMMMTTTTGYGKPTKSRKSKWSVDAGHLNLPKWQRVRRREEDT